MVTLVAETAKMGPRHVCSRGGAVGWLRLMWGYSAWCWLACLLACLADDGVPLLPTSTRLRPDEPGGAGADRRDGRAAQVRRQQIASTYLSSWE